MKTAEIIQFPLFSGANDVTRTHDLLITNQLLYRLSYISIFTFGVADLILTNQLLYRLSYTSIWTELTALIGRPGAFSRGVSYHIFLPASTPFLRSFSIVSSRRFPRGEGRWIEPGAGGAQTPKRKGWPYAAVRCGLSEEDVKISKNLRFFEKMFLHFLRDSAIIPFVPVNSGGSTQQQGGATDG